MSHESHFWSLYSLFPTAIDRPVDWRYRLVRLCFDASPSVIRKLKLDPITRSVLRAERYLRKNLLDEQIPEVLVFLKMRDKFKEVGDLLSLIYDPNKRSLSLDLKCAILAGCDNDKISNEIGVPSRLIDLFHDVFFDVRDRLNIPSIILHYAIFSPEKGYNFNDEETRSLFISYFNGWEAFLFARRRISLTRYVYSSSGPECTDNKIVMNVMKWKMHMLMESLDDPKDFASFAKAVKDYFITDESTRNQEADYLMSDLRRLLSFRLEMGDGNRNMISQESLSKEVFGNENGHG